MFPKDGKYKCTSCGHEEAINEAKAQTVTTDSQEKEMTVISDDVATMPKQKVTCPKCGYGEAYYTIRQTRAADEPETIFYRCCKCNYQWRQN